MAYVAELHVRPFFNGFRLTFDDGSPVLDINGQHLVFATKEAANAVRKATGRQTDALVKRLRTADLSRFMGEARR